MSHIPSLLISLRDKINDQSSHALMGEKSKMLNRCFQTICSLVYLKRKTSVHKILTCCDYGENDELANTLEFY